MTYNRAAMLRKLRLLSALDNKRRLKTYLVIEGSPGISFNDLARKVHAERGLLAYHLGVLKAAELVKVMHERRGRETPGYCLTKGGYKLLEGLSS